MSTLAQRRSARRAYQKAGATSRPGEGKRFKALAKAARLGGARNPEAVAAAIGRKKYGQRQMTRWAVAGKKRAKRRR
ncbi:MAG: hypothetical protein AB1567_08455 [bacterium]